MGIYINMEMPKSCPCELLGIGYDLYCSFGGGIPAHVKEYDECCQNGTRPSWCPLVPVPPHGGLIDRNEFVKDVCNHCDGACEKMPCNCLSCTEDCRCDMILDLLEAPVILPAEEGET